LLPHKTLKQKGSADTPTHLALRQKERASDPRVGSPTSPAVVIIVIIITIIIAILPLSFGQPPATTEIE